MTGQYSTKRYLSNIERDLLEEMLEMVSSDKRAVLQGIIDQFSLPRT